MAGNEQVFDSIVDPIANKQVQELTTNLVALDNQAVDTAKSINILLAATANSKTYADLKKNADDLAKSQKTQQDNIDKTRAAEIRLQQAREKSIDQYNKQNAAFALLNKQYQDAITNAKNIGAALGSESQAFKDATANANALGKQVDAINTPLGDFKNKVSGYANGIADFFSGIYGKIRTLAYILPGVGIGTIFLAGFEGIKLLISQFDGLAGKIDVAKANLANLNSVNKDASDQYGKESTNLKILYAAATDVNNNIHDRTLAVKELQKEFPSVFKNIETETILNGGASASYEQLTKDILDNAKAQAAASKIAALAAEQLEIDFQKQKIINAKQQEIANVKPVTQTTTNTQGGGGNFLDQSVQKKSVADQQQTLKDLLRGELEQQDAKKKALQDQIDFLTKYAGGNNKIAKALSTKDSETNPAVDQKGLLNERLKAIQESEQTILQTQETSLDDRLAAVDKYEVDSINLIQKAEDKKTVTVLEADNLRKNIGLQSGKDRLKIQNDANVLLQKAFQEGIKGQTKAEQDSITDFKDAQDAKLLAIEQNKSDTLKSLADQYSQGKISAADYNQQVSDIEYESSQDRVQTQIDAYQKIIDTQKEYLAFGIGTDKDLQKSQDDLTKFKIQQSDLATKKELDNIKQLESARKDLANLEKEVAGASIDLIQKVVDGGYQNQLNALKKQSDQVNENAQNEKDAINNSLLSTYDKAQKTQIIDKQTAAAQKAITDQENDVKTKQAKFDRIVSLAKIAEATAIAEVQALSYLSNPFTAPLYPAIAALIGALGAIQLASVLATPLPKYEMGGTTYGGALIWGEKGMEKATLPDGSVQYSPNTATVTTFPSGTIITPHLELMQQIRPDKINYAGGREVPWKEVLSELRKNRPVKQKTINRININGSFDAYRKNYFR